MGLFIKEFINTYFSNRKVTGMSVKKFLCLYPKINNELDDVLLKEPEWETKYNFIFGLVNKICLSRCSECQRILKFSCRAGKFCSRACSNKNIETKKNIKQSLTDKFGVDNPAKADTIKHKIKETCLKRYGVVTNLQLNAVKSKIKENAKEKYGVKCYFESNEHKLNSTKKNFEKAWNTIQSYSNFIIPCFNKNEYCGYHYEYLWKCVHCGNIFKQAIHKTNHIKQFPYLPRCWNCYPLIETKTSKKEQELIDFCKQFYPNLIENDRKLIAPYELDIVIPERKLAIEFNGIYWHSIEAGTPLGYHLMKTEMCENKNYRLIHIWEDEWNEQTKKKLIQIFENKEFIDYSKPLDRCWYSNNKNFTIIQPEVIIKYGYHIENCGYLFLKMELN